MWFEILMQENYSANFQDCENSVGFAPESQGQRGAYSGWFLYTADATLFPMSRESLWPDATQTGMVPIHLTRHWTLYLDRG